MGKSFSQVGKGFVSCEQIFTTGYLTNRISQKNKGKIFDEYRTSSYDGYKL